MDVKTHITANMVQRRIIINEAFLRGRGDAGAGYGRQIISQLSWDDLQMYKVTGCGQNFLRESACFTKTRIRAVRQQTAQLPFTSIQ
jgi:hypothetical protein